MEIRPIFEIYERVMKGLTMSKSDQGPRKPATKFPQLQKKLRQNAVQKPSAARPKLPMQGHKRGR
jgi:hypothetical protein